jgi:hypothetical protein
MPSKDLLFNNRRLWGNCSCPVLGCAFPQKWVLVVCHAPDFGVTLDRDILDIVQFTRLVGQFISKIRVRDVDEGVGALPDGFPV